MRYIKRYLYLLNAQHGFMKRRSGKSHIQLLLYANDLLKTHKNVQTDAILLDFSKAFDKMSHTHMKKLEAIGVTCTAKILYDGYRISSQIEVRWH